VAYIPCPLCGCEYDADSVYDSWCIDCGGTPVRKTMQESSKPKVNPFLGKKKETKYDFSESEAEDVYSMEEFSEDRPLRGDDE
jgi:hypothetical protein